MLSIGPSLTPQPTRVPAQVPPISPPPLTCKPWQKSRNAPACRRVRHSSTYPRCVVPHTTYHTDGAHVEDRVVLEDPRPFKRQCVPGDSPPSPPTPPATADDESQPEPAAQKVPKKQVCLITQLVSMYSLDDPERIRLDGNLQSPLRTAARSHPGTRRKSVPGRDLSLWPACHRALSRLLSERDSVRSVHGVGTSP